MASVYLVTSGTYSDYRVEAVFSTREKARAFIRQQVGPEEWAKIQAFSQPATASSNPGLPAASDAQEIGDQYNIEEYDLDQPIEPKRGQYVAELYPDGTLRTPIRWDPDAIWQKTASEGVTDHAGGRAIYTGYGSTPEHARRSADEYRRQDIAVFGSEAQKASIR